MTVIARSSLSRALSGPGFAFVPAADMRSLLQQSGSLKDWTDFAASWNHLDIDEHMADSGRYRHRRHAIYRIVDGTAIVRQPHQPHYQARNYNPLNGGKDRWFSPVTPEIGACASLMTILGLCGNCFGALSPATRVWHVEVHQFRIFANLDTAGQPTPEGMHRDGVDYVLILLVDRANVRGGTTTIADLKKRPLASFVLATPLDAAWVDDARVYHGVTRSSRLTKPPPRTGTRSSLHFAKLPKAMRGAELSRMRANGSMICWLATTTELVENGDQRHVRSSCKIIDFSASWVSQPSYAPRTYEAPLRASRGTAHLGEARGCHGSMPNPSRYAPTSSCVRGLQPSSFAYPSTSLVSRSWQGTQDQHMAYRTQPRSRQKARGRARSVSRRSGLFWQGTSWPHRARE